MVKQKIMKIIKLIPFLLLISFSGCKNKIEADLISHNGAIYSLDDNNNIYEAIAVKNGKIIALGKNDQILNKYTSEKNIDLKGFTVFPGFIDAHCHFLEYGLQKNMVDVSDAQSFKETIELLKLNQDKVADNWLVGYGWDQNKWGDKNWSNNKLLNENFKNINVILKRIDGHVIMANQKAIQSLKIPIDTIILGGYIEKIDGIVTGLFVDNAMSLILDRLPESNEISKKKAILKAQSDCLAFGLTTIDIAGINKKDIDLLEKLHSTDELKIKVYAMLSNNEENFKFYIDSLGHPYKTKKLNVRSFKFFADGSLGSRGACLLKPYSDQENSYGMLLQKKELFEKKLIKIKSSGFQACTHSIGDSTNRSILESYSKILKSTNDLRWRIEHAQCVNNNDIHYFREYNIIPSVQPTQATSDYSWALTRLGRKRLLDCYRYKTLFEENFLIALGTDFPVEKINPINTFFAAVFRKSFNGLPINGFQKNEALSRINTLKGMTIWSALANFEENEKGSLEIGKSGDMVVLNNNILIVEEKDILKTKVLYTVINGEIVYKY